MRNYQIEYFDYRNRSAGWNPINIGYNGELEAGEMLRLIRFAEDDGRIYRLIEIIGTRIINEN